MICDFAETYSIYDYRALPAMYAAVLAVGLRESSRIKMRLSGNRHSLETILLANIRDALQLLIWSRSKQRGAKPAMITPQLFSGEKKEDSETFMTGADFETRRAEIVEKYVR